jgi:hypothetical protein
MVATTNKILGAKVEPLLDRRSSRRFQIVLPVLFRWVDDSVEHYGVGHCGNVGPGGMFIVAAKCPPSGVGVKLEFALPAFDLVPHPLTLCCVGRVSRVEACYQLTGFAVAGRFVNEQANSGTCVSVNELPEVGR